MAGAKGASIEPGRPPESAVIVRETRPGAPRAHGSLLLVLSGALLLVLSSVFPVSTEELRALWTAGKSEQAYEGVSKAVEERPGDFGLQTLWARILLEKRLLTKAEPVVMNLLRQRENEESILVAIDYHLASGNQAKAREWCLRILDRNRRSGEALLRMATLEESAGYPSRSFALYREAGMLASDWEPWLREYGRFLARQERWPELDRHLGAYREAFPKAAALFHLESLRASALGKTDEAIKLIQKALFYESERPEYLRTLRALYLQGNKVKELAAWLRKDASTSNDPLASYQLAWTQIRLGQKGPLILPDKTYNEVNVFQWLDRSLALDENQEAVRYVAEEIAARNLPFNDALREKYAVFHRARAEFFADRGDVEKQGMSLLRVLRMVPQNLDDRKRWADWLKDREFDTSYLDQLKLIRDYSEGGGFMVNAKIMLNERRQAGSLHAKNKIDLLGVEWVKAALLFDTQLTVKAKVLPDSPDLFARMLLDRLGQIHRFNVQSVAGGRDAWLDRNRADFTLSGSFEERPERLKVELLLTDGLRRIPVDRKTVITEGKERWLDMMQQVGQWLLAKIEPKGSLLKVDPKTLLVGLGRRDGLAAGGTLEVRPASAGIDEKPLTILKVDRIEEFLSTATLEDRDALRFLKAGDQVQYRPGTNR